MALMKWRHKGLLSETIMSRQTFNDINENTLCHPISYLESRLNQAKDLLLASVVAF